MTKQTWSTQSLKNPSNSAYCVLDADCLKARQAIGIFFDADGFIKGGLSSGLGGVVPLLPTPLRRHEVSSEGGETVVALGSRSKQFVKRFKEEVRAVDCRRENNA